MDSGTFIYSVSFIILHFHHLFCSFIILLQLFYCAVFYEVGGWSDTMITDLWLRGGQCTQNINSAVPLNYVATIS